MFIKKSVFYCDLKEKFACEIEKKKRKVCEISIIIRFIIRFEQARATKNEVVFTQDDGY